MDISFLFDTITVVMLIVVTSISLCVHLFSVEYMNADPHFIRFMSYLSLFTFFMLLLVTAGNMVQLFVGWEGVGLSSYLLINFWFTRREANKAALKAIIVNRAGDCGLIIALGFIFLFFGTSDFSSIFSLLELLSQEIWNYIFILKLNFLNLNLNEFSFAVAEIFSAIAYLDLCILMDHEHFTWMEVFFDNLISFWFEFVLVFQYWFWLWSSWWPAWGNTFLDCMHLEMKNTIIDLCFYNYKKTSIFNPFELDLVLNLLLFVCFAIIVAAAAKSAQLGLHTWLVDAMEGPTPVSALIHAATMVTAGVFLLVRISPFFYLCEMALGIILFLGAITAVISSITAVFQVDIKKLIAYSTVSQIGFMFIACGGGNFNGAMFHLSTHAFFKALLFLCAGVVIYSLSDEQDMRKMGLLQKYMPFTFMVFIIGSFALSGFPFLSGYYSKDFILEYLFVGNDYLSLMCLFMALCAAFFTCAYSWKLAYFVFLINYNGPRGRLAGVQEPGILMIISLSFLCLGSLFVGYLLKDLFIGLGTDFWGNSLWLNSYYVETPFIPKWLKLFPLLSFCAIGFFLFRQRFFFVIYWFSITYIFIVDDFEEWLDSYIWPYRGDWTIAVLFESVRAHFLMLCTQFHNMIPDSVYSVKTGFFFLFRNFFFDYFYNRAIVYPVLRAGYTIIFKAIDRGLIEKVLGPHGFIYYFNGISEQLSHIDDKFILHAFLSALYVIGFITGLCLWLPSLIMAVSLFTFTFSLFILSV